MFFSDINFDGACFVSWYAMLTTLQSDVSPIGEASLLSSVILIVDNFVFLLVIFMKLYKEIQK